MGQLIKFPDRPDTSKPLAGFNDDDKISADRSGAKVLFFTGVRYERPLSLPSNRLAAPVS